MPAEGSLVLRRQLALPQPYLGPRGDTQRRLAEIWRQVLNLDCVGVADDFVDLGGDSYCAAVIFTLIEEAFGVRVPMATLIDAPTVAALAGEIESAQRRADGVVVGRR
jgi:pyochelin synthetase